MARRFARSGSGDSDSVQGPSRVSESSGRRVPREDALAAPTRCRQFRVGAEQLDRREGFTRRVDYGEMEADRAVLTRKQEEMRHPPDVWIDPSYADEELDRLRQAYLDYCRGRAKPASPPTVRKYNQVLMSFIRSLDRQRREPPVLASLTPTNVNRWVNERRGRGFSEEGIATHLIALKVFSSKYVYRELELTTSRSAAQGAAHHPAGEASPGADRRGAGARARLLRPADL